MEKHVKSDGLKPFLKLIINGKEFEHNAQYISGAEVRQLGKIPLEDEIYLAIARPWEDEVVSDQSKIDLARPEIEHFFSKKKHVEYLVTINVNKADYSISRGTHNVAQIKSLANVPPAYELEEIIDHKFTPLKDNETVLIKGGEIFIAHVRDGASS